VLWGVRQLPAGERDGQPRDVGMESGAGQGSMLCILKSVAENIGEKIDDCDSKYNHFLAKTFVVKKIAMFFQKIGT
jgi:hypothetical protein